MSGERIDLDAIQARAEKGRREPWRLDGSHYAEDVSALLAEHRRLTDALGGAREAYDQAGAAYAREADVLRTRAERAEATLALRREWRDAARQFAAERDLLAATLAEVAALADRWEHGALRWADPLPVPPEVGQVRAILARADRDGADQ
ncbi:hypothetical protein [Xylanimonas ulmi]|uniref:Uncharacterized protein n=1 Tax=Xylanimonas ulmi TaxID=228973 RepID=A0A4Q7M2H7_9MICO|nr:hypothetical protein [Xylanibacterium ulmi]RZS61664.1 hypothetical protein EV386_1974 [Xylanibacterium ulmi]